MDSLSNYINLRQQAAQTSAAATSAAQSKLDDAKKKIREITDPFAEGIVQTSADRLLTMSTNKLADKLKSTAKEAERLKNVYKEGGTKGVIADIKKKFNIGDIKIGGEAPEQTIAGLDKGSFKAARTSIRLSLEQDLDGLSGHQKHVFSRLLQDNVADDVAIPNKLDRMQHNLQKSSDVLEHVKKNVPKELEDKSVSVEPGDIQMRPLNQGSNIHSLDDALEEFHDASETPQELKEYNLAQRPAPAAAAEPASEIQAAEPPPHEPPREPDVPEIKEPDSAENLLKKGLKEGAETDAEAGGPEDVLGDVVALGAGIGVFLGGLRASHHTQQTAVQQVSNFTTQEGA